LSDVARSPHRNGDRPRLLAEGNLDAPEQALDLTFSDVTCRLRGYWNGAGARELAQDRALRRESWLARPPRI